MTPLVFVHGFMGGGDQWAPQEPLSEFRRLHRVDLPGFGKNAHLEPINRIEDFAAWVLEALARDGVDRFDLLGHSMGGMIVQEMAHQAPRAIENLVLYGTGAVGALPDRFEPIEVSMQRACEDGPKVTAARIAKTWFRDGEGARAYSECARIAQLTDLPAIIAGLEAMRDWSGLERLSNIECRTLIVWGEMDRSYAWREVERLWSNIPDSHMAIIPDCAHAVHLELPDVFNRLVGRFLYMAETS